jgi:MFS family permease
VILLEATGFAMLGPALYGLVARGSPPGRSSTAQGIFGAAGTFGTIVAAVAAGYLAAIDIRWPFWVGGIAIAILLVVGLAIGGRAIRSRPAPSGEVVAAVAPGT